jgi:hypothetical protein
MPELPLSQAQTAPLEPSRKTPLKAHFPNHRRNVFH